jgi:hypothetical protein
LDSDRTGKRSPKCAASRRGAAHPQLNGVLNMLWTILIILAIIALVVFILGRVRGRRGI